MSYVLAPNFMRCFINQLASPDRYLHRAAEKTRRAMLDSAKAKPETMIAILTALLTPPEGDVNFDGITKTRTVDTLLSQAIATDQLVDFLTVYDRLIMRPGTMDERLSAVKRQVLADQLVALLKSGQSESISDENYNLYIHQSLPLLAKYAYFDVVSFHSGNRRFPEPAISPKSRDMFRSRISSCLSHLMTKSINQSNVAYALIYNIHGRLGMPASGQSLLDVDANVRSLLDKALGIATYIQTELAEYNMRQKLLQSATLLLSLTMLQVYNGDVDGVTVLEDLNEIFDQEKVSQYRETIAQDSSALVEILLSLVVKPSMMFRRLAQQVFTTFTNDLDESGLHAMLKVYFHIV